MDDCKVAVVTANLGAIDETRVHESQSVNHDSYVFDDTSFPPRFNALTPRLQAKIPKFFAWQLVPDYDYYVWLDSSIRMKRSDTVGWLLSYCESSDFAVFKHDRRTTVAAETQRVAKALRQNSISATLRYENEWIDEQLAVIQADSSFVDGNLAAAGVFIYRNTPQVQLLLKEWWYHVSRYCIQDQISLPYVLETSGVSYTLIDEIYWDCEYVEFRRHQKNV